MASTTKEKFRRLAAERWLLVTASISIISGTFAGKLVANLILPVEVPCFI
jgi:hypothetical protein